MGRALAIIILAISLIGCDAFFGNSELSEEPVLEFHEAVLTSEINEDSSPTNSLIAIGDGWSGQVWLVWNWSYPDAIGVDFRIEYNWYSTIYPEFDDRYHEAESTGFAVGDDDWWQYPLFTSPVYLAGEWQVELFLEGQSSPVASLTLQVAPDSTDILAVDR